MNDRLHNGWMKKIIRMCQMCGKITAHVLWFRGKKITMEKYFVNSIQRRVRKTMMYRTKYLSKIFRVTEIHFPQSRVKFTERAVILFWQKFHETNVFNKESSKKLIWRIFFLTDSKFLSFTPVHCAFTLFCAKISWK